MLRFHFLTWLLFAFSFGSNAQQVSRSYFSPSSVSIDNSGNYGYSSLPTVSFTTGDFPSGCLVSDVDVTINWAKTAGTCTSPTNGPSRHGETSFRIDGPSTNVVLAAPGTWSGDVTTNSVTTTFNQGSPVPSGTPVTGTFGPNGGNLGSFNGTQPFGAWRLRPGDNAAIAPICLTYYTVTVTTSPDVTGPTFTTFPTNLTATSVAGFCGALVSYVTPVATDACGVSSVTRTNGPSSGDFFPVGTTTVTFRATDNYGNITNQSFTVTVTDVENPVITCPSNISVNAASGSCSLPVNFSAATATDNCPGVSVSQIAGSVSGSSFQVGTNTITYRATDAAGRTSQCSFTITVVDNQNPGISCPSSITTNAASGTCAANVTYSTPTGVDNCPGVTVSRTAGPASGSSFGVGTTTVTHVATDASGNTANCSFTVTVVDNQNPVISGCPSNITIPNTTGLCTGVATWAAPTASDNCPGVSIARTTGQNPGTAFALGSTTVTYVATDASSNTATCTFTVTVNDTQNPSITCPSNISVNNSPGQCGRTITFSNASYSDNCPGVTLQQTAGSASGSFFSVGTQTVTFVATDAASNTSTCSLTVTVIDAEAPQFLNCPANVTVNTANGTCGRVVTYPTILANDNCNGSVTPVLQTGAGTVSGSTFPLGTTTVTYTATDAVTNSSTCTFTVTVEDEEAPQMNCPSNQTVTFDGNCQYQILNYVPQVSFLQDNCDNSPSVVQSPAAGSTITGSTVITITATDASGNSTSCTFNVNPNDVVDPVITCPTNQQVAVNAICQFTLPNYTNAVVSDDCDPSPDVTQSPIAGAILTSSTTVVLTVTDASGNDSQCTFLAEPLDASNPTISCPSNQLETFDSNCELALPNYTGLATADDNCDNSPAITQIPAAATVIGGNTVVTLTATDATGNTGSCTFSVIPEDNNNPVITCPADQNVAFNSLCQFTVVNYISLAIATDNCDNSVSVTQSPTAGTSIATTTQVVLTATDNDGNTSNCSFNIIPTDQTDPSLVCPQNQVVNLNSSCQHSLSNYVLSTSINDNCDASLTVSQSPAAGSVISSTTTVIVTATDDDGNSNSCSFQVIPQDVTPPTIVCGSNLTVSFSGSCTYTVGNYVSTPTVSDNCTATPTVTQSPSLGTVITGQTTVTLTATDAAGNAGTCTFQIIPNDTQVPTIACPSNLNVSFSGSCDYTLADYTAQATASDNCDQSLTLTQSPAFGTVITATQVVTITATDDASNSANCTFSVIPADNTQPNLTCPANQLETFTAGCNFVLPSYTGLATVSDNCDNSVLVTQFPSAGTTITGSQTITLTAVDDATNSRTCTFSVIPEDNTPPSISCPSNIPVAFNAQCQYIVLNYTGMATATDNCDQNPVVTQSPVSGTSVGTTSTITLTATDADGNSASCTFQVVPTDQTAPSISCPGTQTVSFGGTCGYTLGSYTSSAIVNDNCDAGPTVTQSPVSGTNITSNTTVTLSVQDAAGNINSCTFSVNPVDVTNPTVTCPSNMNVNFDSGCQFTLADYTGSASASDNCTSSPTLTQSPASGSVITGLTTVTMTAADASGNIGTCTFTITPDDNEDPTISCPTDQVVSSNASCDYLVQDYTGAATVSDNCDLTPTVTQLPAFGTIITVPTTVTLTVTDDQANTANCTFLVTPNDVDEPSISCPGTQLEDVDGNCQFTLVDYTSLATATDNCSSAPTVTQLPASGGVITGSTTITLTATDGDLNTATCTFQVVPVDNTDPVVTCPSNQNASFSAQCQLTLPSYVSLGSASDNCNSGLSISQSPVAGTLIGGTTVITLSSTDAAGNIGTCTFSVFPADNTAPTLTCPTDQVESFDAACEFALPSYNNLLSVFDNCDVAPFTIVQSPASGTVIGGNTTIQFSVTDGAGNTGTCTFFVIPDDDEDPVIICPSNQTVSFNGSCQYVLADYAGDVTVNDNCDAEPLLTQSPAVGTSWTFNSTVTITATDVSGNSASCSFLVIPVDDTDPVVTCPSNQTVNFTSNCEFTIPSYSGMASFSDNCDNTPFVTQSPGIGTIVTGSTVVTITVVDDAANSTSCTFTVNPVDVTVPTVQCPSTQFVDLSALCDYSLADFRGLVNDNDNCDTDLTLIQSPAIGTTVSSTTLITITALDDAGNSATCTFNVVPEDNAVPTLVCPANQTVNLSPTCLFIVQNYTALPTVSDNCDASVSVTQSPLSGSLIGGPTVVTLSGTDDAGNVGSCTFTVTPEDNSAPTIFGCPSNMADVTDPGICGAVTTYATITATDNCDGVMVPVLTTGQASGTVFPLGVTTVTYDATDSWGNTTLCVFTVTITDDEDPIISCPPSVSTFVQPSTCGATVTYSLPTITDNCTSPITPVLVAGLASGSTFSLGSTTVTYSANDGHGNSSQCSFTVTVTDNEDPTIVCPSSIVQNNDLGICGAAVSYSLPTVSDNCNGSIVPTLVTGGASGSIFSFGETTVTYLAEDGNGNSATCSFTVEILDAEDPIITCPTAMVVSVEPTTCQATVSYSLPSVSDNCNNAIVPSITTGLASGSSFPLGVTPLSFLAEDGNGNSATCSFTVEVVDDEDPNISCPSEQFESFNASCQLTMPNYTGLATTSDNCDATPVVTQSPAIGAVVTGQTTVTLTSTDDAGNSSSCTFTVTDDTPPTVSCPANQTVGNDINCMFTLLDYTLLATGSDNCGSVNLTQSPLSGTQIAAQTTVSITATDAFGNSSICTFSITPIDNIEPGITCIGNQVGFLNADCEYELPDYTGQANATDNCDTDPVITQSPAPGSFVGSGLSVITLTATDDNGNAQSCNFNLNTSDVLAPTIHCPSAQIVAYNANCQFALQNYVGMATASDNCTALVTVTQSPAAGTLHSGNTVVTLTATDNVGSSASCAFVVSATDGIAPTIVCPNDIDVDFDADCKFNLLNYTSMAVTDDNCSTSILVTQSPSQGTVINDDAVIMLTANDGNGNSATCTFSVLPEDNTPPTLVCPQAIAVPFNANCQFVLEDYIGSVTADDNCTGIIPISQSPASGTVISAITTVTFTGSDGNGNSGTCTVSVTPSDFTSPQITCPSDVVVDFNESCSFLMADYTGSATTSDNCSGNITVVQNIAVGTLITGDVSLTLTASDNNGNSHSCSFNILPQDVLAPVPTCPDELVVNLDGNCAFTLEDYSGVVNYYDNCSAVTVSQVPSAGTVITSDTQVEMSFVDDNGNASNCTFFVLPFDNDGPTISCPTNQTVSLDANCQFQLVDYSSIATSSDNCGIVSTTQFPPAGTFIVNATVVELTVEDANGALAECQFAVVPQDVIPPTIAVCPPDQEISLGANCQTTMPNFTGLITAVDNCDATPQYGQLPAAGSTIIGLDQITVQVGAADNADNIVACTFTLNVVDATAPTVNCPPTQALQLSADCNFILPDYTTLATSFDACGNVSLSQSPEVGSLITTQLNASIIATDESGNQSTCTFFVNPVPMQISVTGTDVTCNGGSDGTATVTISGGNAPFAQNWGGFNPAALTTGNYSVTVTDVNGCSQSSSIFIADGPLFELQITPSGQVQICEGSSVQLNAGAGYAAYNWSTGATVQTVTVSNPATYWVSVVNADGCVSSADTVYLSYLQPLVPNINETAQGLLVCTNDSSSSYQWYFNGAPISGATNYDYCPTQSGNYTVVVIDANGCEVESTTSEYTFMDDSPCATGIQEHDLSLDVYPNPSTGQFTVRYAFTKQMDVQLTVYDLMGKQVVVPTKLTSMNGTSVIDLSQQTDGVYTLRIEAGADRLYQERLILVK